MPEVAARPIPVTDPSMIRAHLEIDGKLVSVGLPSLLLGALSGAGNNVVSTEGTVKRDKADLISAPVSGVLQAFKVEDGASAVQGDLLAVMEAMKMETQVVAPKAGTVRLLATAGDYLDAGAALIVYRA